MMINAQDLIRLSDLLSDHADRLDSQYPDFQRAEQYQQAQNTLQGVVLPPSARAQIFDRVLSAVYQNGAGALPNVIVNYDRELVVPAEQGIAQPASRTLAMGIVALETAFTNMEETFVRAHGQAKAQDEAEQIVRARGEANLFEILGNIPDRPIAIVHRSLPVAASLLAAGATSDQTIKLIKIFQETNKWVFGEPGYQALYPDEDRAMAQLTEVQRQQAIDDLHALRAQAQAIQPGQVFVPLAALADGRAAGHEAVTADTLFTFHQLSAHLILEPMKPLATLIPDSEVEELRAFDADEQVAADEDNQQPDPADEADEKEQQERAERAAEARRLQADEQHAQALREAKMRAEVKAQAEQKVAIEILDLGAEDEEDEPAQAQEMSAQERHFAVVRASISESIRNELRAAPPERQQSAENLVQGLVRIRMQTQAAAEQRAAQLQQLRQPERPPIELQAAEAARQHAQEEVKEQADVENVQEQHEPEVVRVAENAERAADHLDQGAQQGNRMPAYLAEIPAAQQQEANQLLDRVRVAMQAQMRMEQQRRHALNLAAAQRQVAGQPAAVPPAAQPVPQQQAVVQPVPQQAVAQPVAQQQVPAHNPVANRVFRRFAGR